MGSVFAVVVVTPPLPIATQLLTSVVLKLSQDGAGMN